MSKVISVRIPDDYDQKIDALARAKKLKRSAYISLIIRRGLISDEIGPPALTKREKFILSHIS